jgi:hypothetical protein
MNPTATELAALQARIAELETENTTLKTEVEGAEKDAAIQAKEAELADANRQLATLKAEAESRAKRDADAVVASAVARGAIAAKDTASQEKWRGLILADPKNAELLARQPGAPAVTAGRITRPVQVVQADVGDCLRGYMAASTPRERGVIYQREFRPILERGERIAFERAPMQADNTLNTLAGNLVAQRTLDLIVSRRPMLLNVTADFSDQMAVKGQTIYTRTIAGGTMQDFASAATDVTSTDYPVTLTNHKQVLVAFKAAEYLATNRNLVQEWAEANAFNLGNGIVDAVAALITDAYTSETVGAASAKDFSALTTAAKALNTNGAPDFARSAWINSDFAEALANDEVIMEYLDGNNRTAYGHWTNIKGFEHVWEFPALPANAVNLIGFAFQRSALILATRVADDPARLVGAGYPGALQVVTDPVTGFSVLTDRWIDPTTRQINTRIDVLYGIARAVVACGHKFVSA